MSISKNNAKREYNFLLKSGALLDLYEDMQGNWEEDEEAFIKIYDANQFFLGNLEVDEYDEI